MLPQQQEQHHHHQLHNLSHIPQGLRPQISNIAFSTNDENYGLTSTVYSPNSAYFVPVQLIDDVNVNVPIDVDVTAIIPINIEIEMLKFVLTLVELKPTRLTISIQLLTNIVQQPSI
jgi:hypothetical protein